MNASLPAGAPPRVLRGKAEVMASAASKFRARGTVRLLGLCALAAVLAPTACGQLTEGGVVSVAYAPDNRLVAFGNGATYVFDADAGREMASFFSPGAFSHIPIPAQMSLSADGNSAAIGNGPTVDIYDVARHHRRAHIAVDPEAPEEVTPIAGVALSHDGTLVAVSVRPLFGSAPHLRIWRVADQVLQAEAQPPTGRQSWSWGAGLAFSGDDSVLYALLSGGAPGERPTSYLTSWNVADGSPRAEAAIASDLANGTAGLANLLASSADGTTLATVGTELLRWDAVTLALLPDFPAPAAFGTNSIAFSPDGRNVVTTHATNAAPDPQIVGPDGLLVRSWSIAESGMCESAVFSPDGARIAAACSQYLRIWDIASGVQVRARKVTGKVY